MGTLAVPLNLQAAQKGKAMNEATAQDSPAKQRSPRRGRRTKYTLEIVKLICDMIGRGLNYCQAADAAGIHRDTLHEWERQKSAFSDALKRAKASGVDRRLKRIEKAAAKGAWQADAWWLERNHPETWGRKSRETAEEQAAAAAEAAKRAQAETEEANWNRLTVVELKLLAALLDKANSKPGVDSFFNHLSDEDTKTMHRVVRESEYRMYEHAANQQANSGVTGASPPTQAENKAHLPSPSSHD